MEVIKSPNFKRRDNKPVSVAIGAFDGLHLGHQKIIEKTISIAEKKNTKSAVFSFKPHPLKIIKPEKAPSQIISESQKKELLAQQGINYYFQQKFTKDFSRTSFDSFIKNILVKKIGIIHIVVGNDFRFGYKGKGNIKLMKEYGEKFGFGITILSNFELKGEKVSSSHIRKIIRKGKVEKVSEFLGFNYTIEGIVVHGKGRGHKLGFPTANLKYETDYVLPPSGVYAGYANYNEKAYKAVANFGYKPTFSGENYSIEIHIIDFAEKLYNKKISFELIKKIRDEKKYSDIKNLKQQMQKDILYTNEILC